MLFLSCVIIQKSQSVTGVLTNSVALTFIVDIDEAVGGAALRTLQDGQNLFKAMASYAMLDTMSHTRGAALATSARCLQCAPIMLTAAACRFSAYARS